MPTTTRSRRSAATACLAALALGVVAPVADAKHGDDGGGGSGRGGGDEHRARGASRCGHAARTGLDVRGRDGAMRFTYEFEHGRGGESWRVVVVQEGRVVWRGTRRLSRSGGFEVRLTLRDLPGDDRIDVRASGPRGTACSVGTTLED